MSIQPNNSSMTRSSLRLNRHPQPYNSHLDQYDTDAHPSKRTRQSNPIWRSLGLYIDYIEATPKI